MPLTKKQIDEILAKKASRSRGGSRKKNEPDVDDRSYTTWFKLIHKIMDEDNEMINCGNEHCVDTRDRTNGQMCVKVKGQWVCRYCFLDGWMLENPAQQTIA